MRHIKEIIQEKNPLQEYKIKEQSFQQEVGNPVGYTIIRKGKKGEGIFKRLFGKKILELQVDTYLNLRGNICLNPGYAEVYGQGLINLVRKPINEFCEFSNLRVNLVQKD